MHLLRVIYCPGKYYENLIQFKFTHCVFREETRVDREIFFDAIMSMKHKWSREIPPPIGYDADGREEWTGRQLLSMAMPQELNVEKGNVKIYNGLLVSGTLNKKYLGVGSGSLVHLVVQQLGKYCRFFANPSFVKNRIRLFVKKTF